MAPPTPTQPLVQSYHPTTFLDRGVAVPFTTPLLAGTRARPAERGGTELVVPNPSGGRGVYILPWGDLRALCNPTVHDRRLNERAAALPAIAPSSIRDVARQVAAEGLAGPAARQAAESALEADRRDRLLTNFLLLMLVVKQIGSGLGVPAETPLQRAPDLGERARQAVMLIAARLGQPADTVAANLETLADLLTGIGLPDQTEECRIPRLLRTLRRVHDEVSAWRGQRGDGNSTLCAEMVVSAGGLTLTCAETTLAEAHGLTNDITALLRDWATAPGKIAQVVARPDWLLDGWEQICSLWDDATDPADRPAALVEMALLVPILPQETASWIGVVVDPIKMAAYRRKVLLNEDWRTGMAVFALIARNERLRSMAA